MLLCGCRGVLLLLLSDPGDVFEQLRDAAQERWRSTAPTRQTRLIIHVSVARILYVPPSTTSEDDDTLDLSSDENGKSGALSVTQIRAVDAACASALEELGLRGLEFFADALWYTELQSADLEQTAYSSRFSLRVER